MASNKRIVMEVFDDGSISVKPMNSWSELIRFVSSMNTILKQCQQTPMDILYEQRQAALEEYRNQYESTNHMDFQCPTTGEGEDVIDGLSELEAVTAQQRHDSIDAPDCIDGVDSCSSDDETDGPLANDSRLREIPVAKPIVVKPKSTRKKTVGRLISQFA